MAERSIPRIFSQRRRAARVARAMIRQARPDAARFLLDAMAEETVERLGFMQVKPGVALVIGDLTGMVTAYLQTVGAEVETRCIGTFDEESPIAFEKYDLVVTIGSLDTLNDVPGALLILNAAMKPGGLLLAVFSGAGSLTTLKAAMMAADGERPAARIHPQIDARGGADLLARANFRSQVADSFTLSVSYGTLQRLIDDLRDQGMGSALASHSPSLTASHRALAEKAFADLGENGRTLESFEIVTLTGWKA
ncbi:hypothetical protein HME9302_01104 [Alteripontixanthobacter maritimus]|uniref:Methyltransferase n=1 Tax=Alteripontixanthobacter maritimus TaxID=2161824 RepID=A0A369Q9G9_9SPHN|nr:class I SAM-dependent methyltransferase [Alteripontixanthobacter maritimus]RDC59907.1 hypothetical protein HME9302_01104 [Alteripontixanthobacter maritimus]